MNHLGSPAPRVNLTPRMGAIFGTGRSGTTWLGAIVSSHPDVAYRFEPLNRVKALAGAAETIPALIRSPTFTSADLPCIYEALLPAYPELEKPPFFRKRYRMRMQFGRGLMWPLARRSRAVATLFRSVYTPQGSPYLIFKEIAAEHAFQQLASKTSLPLIYLVRHPCATVHSILKGQERGLLGAGRQRVASAFVRDHAPELWQRIQDRIDNMLPYEKEALLWRTNVERCYRACKASSNGLLAFYENLCRDPIGVSTQVLHHLGLEMDRQVLGFIQASTGAKALSRLRFGEVGIRPYFSVFRDPAESMNAWASELGTAERRAIKDLVSDSEVFSEGSQVASWAI